MRSVGSVAELDGLDGAVGGTAVDVGAEYVDVVAFCVVGEDVWWIEAHGLVVKEGAVSGGRWEWYLRSQVVW